MKILVIPDLHEKDIWKKAINQEWSKVVFLGDFVDSFDHDKDKCINNLLDIIEFKKSNPDNIILLLGNHDIQYINSKYRCSGYKEDSAAILKTIFEGESKLFKVAYLHDNYLFTHAGVSKKWFNFFKSKNEDIYDKSIPLNVLFNDIHSSSRQQELHTVSHLRGGSHLHGGITWADKQETMEGIIPNYHQIVGHSKVPEIIKASKIMGTTYKDRSITYTDCLDTKEEFLILDI